MSCPCAVGRSCWMITPDLCALGCREPASPNRVDARSASFVRRGRRSASLRPALELLLPIHTKPRIVYKQIYWIPTKRKHTCSRVSSQQRPAEIAGLADGRRASFGFRQSAWASSRPRVLRWASPITRLSFPTRPCSQPHRLVRLGAVTTPSDGVPRSGEAARRLLGNRPSLVRSPFRPSGCVCAVRCGTMSAGGSPSVASATKHRPRSQGNRLGRK
jgi:hypothetical protein